MGVRKAHIRVIKCFCRRSFLERYTVEGNSPVLETKTSLGFIQSSTEHVKFCVNMPGPPGKAKYIKTPIVNKYREGKVKRTPNRGVK
jgi:hypothetical protein